MCGGCWRCGEPTYGMIPHTEENCINALKGALRAARDGREMVRVSLTADLNEFREGLTEALNAHGVPAMPSWREAIDWLAANGGSATKPLPERRSRTVVDRLGNIERDQKVVAGLRASLRKMREDQQAYSETYARNMERVRAENDSLRQQLRGAVEALRQIVAIHEDTGAHPDDDAALDAVADIAARTLASLGGQCAAHPRFQVEREDT